LNVLFLKTELSLAFPLHPTSMYESNNLHPLQQTIQYYKYPCNCKILNHCLAVS
jgi:hypothetical protein